MSRAEREPTSARHPIVRYGVAIMVVVVAAAVRGALHPILQENHAFTLFFAAIALTAWFSGFGPSILAVVVSYLIADWLFLSPRREFDFFNYTLDNFIGLSSFVLAGLAIAFTTRALHRAKDRAEAQRLELEQEIIRREQTERELQQAKAEITRHAETLEQRVTERTASLQETIRALEEMCYHIAHNLRAPLRAVHGFAHILAEDFGSSLAPEARGYLKRLTDAGQRMDTMICCLLDYGRLGHMEVESREIDLERVVGKTIEHFEPEVQAKGASITVARSLLPVKGDLRLLNQVLENLLDNALKFVPPGRAARVRIWTEQRKDLVRVVVEDNGIGVPRNYQHRLFQVFERLCGSDSYPGNGIGLAMVAKAAQRMGGKVGAESEPDQGSRFWIEIPGAA